MDPLAQALPRVLSELLRGTPTSPGKIDFAWKAAVGPATGRATHVHLEGTTLLVEGVSPEWRREIARSSRVILHRLQRLLGDDVIKDIIIRD